MIDEDNLRERFAQLRAEERSAAPVWRRALGPAIATRHAPWRMLAAAAALLLIVIITMTLHSRATKFTNSERAVVRSVAAWHSPTDFLLRTPGSEMLTTTPRIPDLKGIPR